MGIDQISRWLATMHVSKNSPDGRELDGVHCFPF